MAISTLAFQDFQNLNFYETKEEFTSYNKNNWDDIVQNHVLYSNCSKYYVKPMYPIILSVSKTTI